MTKKEIKEKIDASGLIWFSKDKLYEVFRINKENSLLPSANGIAFPDFFPPVEPDKKLIAKYGKYSCVINSHLLDRQNAWKKLNTIKKLHVEKMKVFEKMEICKELELPGYAKNIEDIEFKLQKVWGFPQDINFHRWFDVPKCICPKMDNEDFSGTKFRSYNLKCPVHKPLNLEEELNKLS